MPDYEQQREVEEDPSTPGVERRFHCSNGLIVEELENGAIAISGRDGVPNHQHGVWLDNIMQKDLEWVLDRVRGDE